MALKFSFVKFGRQCFMRNYASEAPAREGVIEKLNARKKLFQEDNDIPVHIKGGVKDNILTKLTAVLCVGGSLAGLYTVAKMVIKS